MVPAVCRGTVRGPLRGHLLPGSLVSSVQRARVARQYGLKTYFRMSASQRFPKDDPIFDAHPEIRGALTWQADGEYVLCTEHPLVRRYLAESVDGIIEMHLGTPLVFTGYALGLPGYNYGKEAMDYGGIPFTRAGPWNDLMFPITPIELRPGVILAEERILTNRSGRFGWGDSSAFKVSVYDGQGNLMEEPNVREITIEAETFAEIRMPSDYMAVLVRLNGTR